MNITRIGMDLAKNVIQVHGVDHEGKKRLARLLKREKMIEFFQNQPP
jgi:transposase